ncbi:MAG TPA: RNA polymerase sigma factor [Spirochaetales bacterium]|nr:RNA polymerase sigma factor [Spirochaetia bacterium]HPE36164.1 RNA polymerase sigma factor [Spirochaetales bacterium]
MNEETDDRTALERVVSGDTEAFRILVDRYSDRLYRFCAARLGDADEAEDAVQDVFIRAYRSLSSFDPARGFAPWLFAIAANRVKSRYASRSAAGQLVEAAGKELLAGDGPAEASAEDGVLRDLAAAELRSALAGLPASMRAPVELYYFAGLDVAQVAASLGLGTEAVKSRLFRARKELARRLAGQPDTDLEGR